MLGYAIVGLIIGWLLSLFGFDRVVIYGVQTVFGAEINIYVYYLVFFILGIAGYVIDAVSGGNKH